MRSLPRSSLFASSSYAPWKTPIRAQLFARCRPTSRTSWTACAATRTRSRSALPDPVTRSDILFHFFQKLYFEFLSISLFVCLFEGASVSMSENVTMRPGGAGGRTLPAPEPAPRESLLDAIRNAGGVAGLKVRCAMSFTVLYFAFVKTQHRVVLFHIRLLSSCSYCMTRLLDISLVLNVMYTYSRRQSLSVCQSSNSLPKTS